MAPAAPVKALYRSANRCRSHGYNLLMNMRVRADIEQMDQDDVRRAVKCIEPNCGEFATFVSKDQEMTNGILMKPTERLHCRHHAEQFASDRRIPMPSGA